MSATPDPVADVCSMPFQGSVATFGAIPGEYGPKDCGCRMSVVEFDPVGPRLVIVGATSKHSHDLVADFPEAWDPEAVRRSNASRS